MDWLEKSRRYCTQAKYVAEEMQWRDRANHHGALSAGAALLDARRVVIPGLEFLGEVQFRTYGPYQKYSLMALDGGRRLRVFTLEVMPGYKRSHVEPGLEIFGSHILLGDAREAGKSHSVRRIACNLSVASVTGWIARFQRHARVRNDGPYPLVAPFTDDLFGEQ